jgi:hypothetical protein
MPERNWRIRPTPAVEHAVEQIARKEGRSLSNTLHKLLTEAIDARRQLSSPTEVERLVAILRAPADADISVAK